MPYIIKESTACMPSSCKYRYYHLAVLEVVPGTRYVSMISNRARGVVRIVQRWGPYPARGSTARSAKIRAYAESEALCEKLNREERARNLVPDAPTPIRTAILDSEERGA